MDQVPPAPPLNPDGSVAIIPLTPEQLAALPHDDQGPHLVAAIWVLIGLATTFLGLRIYCKWLRHRGLWWDDWILIGAWVCITAESGILTWTTTLGYGKHIWDMSPDPVVGVALLKGINVAGTLSLTAAVWSKTSFALTLLRLTQGWFKGLLWFIMISMNIAMGLSALFIWVKCTPIEASWNPFIPSSCWPVSTIVNYNIFSAAYSAAMDIALALLPWKLIWGLQMKKKEKMGVAVAMSCGVFAGITAIIKTSKIHNMANPDPAAGVDLFIWGNAESCVTIVAASIPILRVLVREVSTSARRKYYYGTSASNVGGTAAGTARRGTRMRSTHNTVVVTGGARSRISHHGEKLDNNGSKGSRSTGDEWSDDKSILEGRASPGKIVRRDEINVEYADRKDGESVEYEMNHLPPV